MGFPEAPRLNSNARHSRASQEPSDEVWNEIKEKVGQWIDRFVGGRQFEPLPDKQKCETRGMIALSARYAAPDMLDEQKLIEKLQRIEALFAGAATPGERDAAAHARERIRARLSAQQNADPPIEYSFNLRDRWSHKLMIALMRRYQIRPYRYPGQRHTTVMARLPKSFVDETLWPEFEELNRTLASFLSEVTDRVIAHGIESNMAEVDVAPERLPSGAGGVTA